MDPLIDHERIAALEELMKEPLGGLVDELAHSVDESIERARQALRVSDLDTTARAAHRGRNDALIVGAGSLERALAALEKAARDGESAAAEAAFQAVVDAWSMTRPELLAAAQAR
jgi:HPt (histidine-containing phosphotransfer) domain-containing protein